MFVAAEQLPYYAEVLHKERPFGELEQRILGFLSEERTHKQIEVVRPGRTDQAAAGTEEPGVLFPDRAPQTIPRVIGPTGQERWQLSPGRKRWTMR